MSCGISAEVQAIKDQMTAKVDGLTKEFAGEAEAGKGLLDQLSGLKSKVESAIEGLSADILAAVPQPELPQGKLQDLMGDFVADPTNPAAFTSKINEMAEKFGKDALNSALSGLGIDPTKANEQLDKFNSLKQKGQAALEQLSQGALNIANLPKDVKDAISIAQGDFSSLASSIEGMVPKDFNPAAALDNLCASVPNIEIGPDGVKITKGVPASVPSKDAEGAPPPEAPKDVPPPETKQTNTFVKSNKTIDVITMSKSRDEIFTAFRERLKFASDSIYPQAISYKRLVDQAKEDPTLTVSKNIIDLYWSWRNYYFIHNADCVIELHNEYKNAGLKFKQEHIPTFKIEKDELEEKCVDPGVRASITALKYVEILE